MNNTMANSFRETKVPQQKQYINSSSTLVPLILTPNNLNTSSSHYFSFIKAIKSHKEWLNSRLISSGAILFRGFRVSTPSEFNDVVEAFGYEEFPYVGGAAPRTKVVGRVYTANEAPPHQKFSFHHEMAYVHEFPSKLILFCEVEPKNGGETPIVLSHVIYERMKATHPEFVREIEEHGLLYIRFLGEEDNVAYSTGTGWKSTFLTDDKSVAEQRAAKLGIKLEWLDYGAKAIMGPIPAIRYDESRQRKVWFNVMVAACIDEPTKEITLGNGKPLPMDILHDCVRILEEECVEIPWQKGDVLLIDNWAILHSRRPFDPPRRVLASLCK